MYIQLTTYKSKHPKKKATITLWLSSVVLVILSFVGKGIAAANPDFVEKYFSRGLYSFTSEIQRVISNLLPFSLYESVIILLILFILYRLIQFIRSFFKKNIGEEVLRFITQMVFILSAGFFLFHFLWSLNNYRIPLKDQLGLVVKETSVEQLASTYKALVLRANETRERLEPEHLSPSRVREVLDTTWKGYLPLADEYDIFHSRRVRVKGLWFSRIQTISGYGGVYSFITGEPNINIEPPLVTLPHTAAHEIAHQMGIGLEDEANYAGFLACKNHPDPLFQYSGYLSAVTYTGNALFGQSPELYYELSALLSEKVRSDHEEIRDFWDRYRNESAMRIADSMNETYLKSHNQPEGLKSYGAFVDLLIAEYMKLESSL